MKFSHYSTLITAVASSTTVLAAPHDAKSRRANDENPVCIVGAGPAGLTAAATLESKGRKAVIFEKQQVVGGKCQSYYDENKQYHPLGALLYSNGTYTETVKVIDAMGVSSVEISPQRGAGMDWEYDYKTGKFDKMSGLNFITQGVLDLEVKRYNKLWNEEFKQYAIVGFKVTPTCFRSPVIFKEV